MTIASAATAVLVGYSFAILIDALSAYLWVR